MDIDDERLSATEQMATSAGIAVEATLDRRAALDGADYVMTMFQVGGYRPATVIDFAIPKQFGLRQTIEDTVGIGGIIRGLRTIPCCSTCAASCTGDADPQCRPLPFPAGHRT